MNILTLTEIELIIPSLFLSVDEKRVAWNKLTNDDKQVLINKASLRINNYNLKFFEDEDIPEDYKIATTYETLSYLSDEEKDSYSISNNGVQSETIGGYLTTSYFKSNKRKLQSLEAIDILKKYKNRQFNIY